MNLNLKDFLIILGNHNKAKFILLLFLSFVGSFLDILSIGSIPIFIISILEPKKFSDFFLLDDYNFFEDLESNEIVLWASLIVGLIFIIKNIYMIFLIYFESKFVKAICINNGAKIFENYTKLDIQLLKKLTQSRIIRNLTSENFQASEIVRNSLYLIREFLIIISLAIILIYTDPIISLIIFILLGFFSFLFFFMIKKKLRLKGEKAQIHRSNQIKSISETFDFIKEIKILNQENYVHKVFKKELAGQMINNEYYNVISKFPKIFLETLSIIGIIFACVFYVYLNKEILDLIPVLSLLAISVVRLMPSFNLITSLFSTISYYTPSLKVISKELNSVENNIEENYFPSKNFESIIISLKDISFYYEKEKKVLENISLKINEKDKILITGKTGSGKSTLIDILMGFLEPISGEIIYSKKFGRSFQTFLSNIGYVPQDIYLINDTIKKNITFGIEEEKVNEKRIEDIIEICQLKGEIAKFPQGINSIVGERGSSLSGGQKQRVAIARALYRDPKILFFDEISSALDLETERKLIFEICEKLKDKTIIIISHSLQFKKFANKIIELESIKK